MINWVKVEYMQKDDSGRRVLTFSPVYNEGDPMRYRVMDAQFVRISTEVTHVAYLNEPEEI